jgi:sulfide:quinone oxidoreductase
MARIVIIGAGVGGVPAALEMKHHARKGDEVMVVSDTPTFHFTPSNPWVGFGWRKPEKIKVPLAPMFKKRKISFVQQALAKVHPKENRLELKDGSSVTYDYLILATGPRLAFDEIPGLGPHGGFTKSVCHVDHAAETFQAWEKFCEAPGPMIVGAAQGASCFGPAYEYLLQADTDLRRRRIRDKVPITYVTSEPYIGHLGLGGVGDSKGLMEGAFRDKTVRWICNAKIQKVEDGKMFVMECDDEGKDKKAHELPFKMSMILPAFTGVDAVRGIEGLTNPRGFILINDKQQNPAFPNIYGVGVCVAIAPKEPTPVATGIPKTGIMIEAMAVAAAHNIRAQLDGRQPDKVPEWNALCVADTGDNGSMAFIAIPQIPPRNVTVAKKGRMFHWGKIIFEKYFLRKVRTGVAAPFYEKLGLGMMGYRTLKK